MCVLSICPGCCHIINTTVNYANIYHHSAVYSCTLTRYCTYIVAVQCSVSRSGLYVAYYFQCPGGVSVCVTMCGEFSYVLEEPPGVCHCVAQFIVSPRGAAVCLGYWYRSFLPVSSMWFIVVLLPCIALTVAM